LGNKLLFSGRQITVKDYGVNYRYLKALANLDNGFKEKEVGMLKRKNFSVLFGFILIILIFLLESNLNSQYYLDVGDDPEKIEVVDDLVWGNRT